MIRKVLFWLVMTIVFVVLTFTILIAALGYRINWMNLSVRQTSLIWLKGNEKNIGVYLNNKKFADHLPVRIGMVDEGWKEVVVKKNGYYDWRKSLHIESDMAYEFRDIVLFKKGSKPELVTDLELVNSLKSVVVPMNINVVNGELTANDRLVTRFFTNPVSYQWYKDKHIIFQIDKSIRVIDLSGLNDNVLVNLESDKPSVFKVIKGGKYLLYSDGDQVKEVQIR